MNHVQPPPASDAPPDPANARRPHFLPPAIDRRPPPASTMVGPAQIHDDDVTRPHVAFRQIIMVDRRSSKTRAREKVRARERFQTWRTNLVFVWREKVGPLRATDSRSFPIGRSFSHPHSEYRIKVLGRGWQRGGVVYVSVH